MHTLGVIHRLHTGTTQVVHR